MEWLHWLKVAGYMLGGFGIIFLGWSLIKGTVSLTGLTLLTVGFLSLVLADVLVYYSLP